jgi:hypothetical protein
VHYLNNVLEQDHRNIKRRVRASQHFRSFWGAWRAIAGYEAILMIRKGQACCNGAGAEVGLLHRYIFGLFAATNWIADRLPRPSARLQSCNTSAVLTRCSELTGLPAEELINFFLAEYFENFNEDNQDNFCEETIGLLKFKDRESAARTLAWIERRVRKGHKGKFPIFESSIDELPDGRFQIDAFKTWSDGECIRVC